MKCVAEAVVGRGVKGLLEFVPGGQYLHDVGADALKRYREKRARAALEDEVKEMIAAKASSSIEAAERAVADAARTLPAREQALLKQFLTAMPDAARQSMKRRADPTGRTAPAGFAVRTPDDVARLLPQHPPRFVAGDSVPNLSSWVLRERLGGGGFGEVWLAEHAWKKDLPRAAFKFCTDPAARTRLVTHEKDLIVRVMERGGDHPNIVPLLDCNLDGEVPWLKYEYVAGGTLADLIHGWQRLAPSEILARATTALHTLAGAVAHFHRLAPPVVHRDLKPVNVLVTGEGGSETLRVTDFGIGGASVEYQIAEETRGGHSLLGRLPTQLSGSYSLLYASPEQRSGEAPDPRDDIHALGVIAYQMLTGRLDVAPGRDMDDDLADAGVPAWLIALIGRSVAQKAARRPRDAGEWEAELARHLPRAAAAGQDRPRRKGPPAAPVVTDVTVPLETIANGGSVSIEVDGRLIDVKIPPGVPAGKKLRVPAAATGSADVLLRVNAAPHPYFRREGDDLFLDVPISLREAVLGGSVVVPTLYGERLEVKVRPGTSSGAKVRLRGKGVGVGDQYLVFKILVPPGELADHSRELMRQFVELNPVNVTANHPWA